MYFFISTFCIYKVSGKSCLDACTRLEIDNHFSTDPMHFMISIMNCEQFVMAGIIILFQSFQEGMPKLCVYYFISISIHYLFLLDRIIPHSLVSRLIASFG